MEKPGDVLQQELKNRNLDKKTFAQNNGLTVTQINKIIKNELSISPDTAMIFEMAFDIPYQHWLDMQKAYNDEIKSIKIQQLKKLLE